MKHPRAYKWPLAVFGLIAAFLGAQLLFTPGSLVNQALVLGIALVAVAGLVAGHRRETGSQSRLAIMVEYGILFLLLLFVGLSVF